MPTPLFLDLEQVMRLHASMIKRYGGTEGTRDVGLLQSAVAMPQMAYGGESLHADIFEMAAAYLYHLVQNHPFTHRDCFRRADTAVPGDFAASGGVDYRRFLAKARPNGDFR